MPAATPNGLVSPCAPPEVLADRLLDLAPSTASCSGRRSGTRRSWSAGSRTPRWRQIANRPSATQTDKQAAEQLERDGRAVRHRRKNGSREHAGRLRCRLRSVRRPSRPGRVAARRDSGPCRWHHSKWLNDSTCDTGHVRHFLPPRACSRSELGARSGTRGASCGGHLQRHTCRGSTQRRPSREERGRRRIVEARSGAFYPEQHRAPAMARHVAAPAMQTVTKGNW